MNTWSEKICFIELVKEKQKDDQFLDDLVLNADSSRKKPNDDDRGPIMLDLGAFSEQTSPKGL